MEKKSGKSGIAIVFLTVIILVALVPWYFIIRGNFGDPENQASTQPSQQVDAEHEPADEGPPDNEPDHYPEYEDYNEDEYNYNYEEADPNDSEQGSDEQIVRAETVLSIAAIHPGLHDELNAVSRQYNAVAVSMTIYDGEANEFYTYEYGYADLEAGRPVYTDTKFRVASLAKLTTVICAMALVDEGLLDLDADISLYLGYDVINTSYPGTAITTRMLMQHTSSIFDSGAFQVSRDRNTSESVRILLERGSSKRRGQPGTNFEYTNFGYAVLGAVCESVSQRSLDTLARDVLFNPLSIDAGYVPSKMHDVENVAVIYNDRHTITKSVQSQMSIMESQELGHDLHLAQGNLTISIRDYARILAMLGNGGALQGVRILSPEAVSEMHIANVAGAAYAQGLATRYSFGDILPEEGFYWHTGSAYGLFSQYVYGADLSLNRGIVVVATGATTGREPNGMVSLNTDLIVAGWNSFNYLRSPYDQNGYDNVNQ